MYQPLVACSGCRRHVRALDERCPFCGAPRDALVVEHVQMARMSRAATLATALAIAAGCHSEPTTITHDPAPAKPSPEPLPPKPSSEPLPAADAHLVDDPGGQVDIYGAPPPPPSSTSAKPKPTVPAPPYGIPPPPPPKPSST